MLVPRVLRPAPRTAKSSASTAGSWCKRFRSGQGDKAGTGACRSCPAGRVTRDEQAAREGLAGFLLREASAAAPLLRNDVSVYRLSPDRFASVADPNRRDAPNRRATQRAAEGRYRMLLISDTCC